MKVIMKSILVPYFFGLLSFVSGFEQPESRIHNLKSPSDRDLQAFWESGFCQAQLAQCQYTVGSQKNSFPWPQIDGLLSGILGQDDEYYYLVEGTRQTIADLATVDFNEIPASFEELAENSDPSVVEALQDSTLQLKNLNVFTDFPNGAIDAFLDLVVFTLDNINLLLEDDINVQFVVNGINSLFFFIRESSLPPFNFLSMFATMTTGVLTLVNTLLPYVTGDETSKIEFCPADLISCTLEMLTRYVVIAASDTVLSIVDRVAGTP